MSVVTIPSRGEEILIPVDDMLAWLSERLTYEARPVRGHLEMWLNGEKIEDKHNLIVAAGHTLLAARFLPDASPPGAISHVAIGTGSTAEAAAQTALVTQVHRKAVASYTRGSGANSNVLTATAQFGDNEGSGLIAEAGLFNADSGGDMYARTLLTTPRQKNSSDTLDLTWTLTF